MERERGQRLSARALYALLDTSHAESKAALLQTTAMAETYPHPSSRPRLIAVAINTAIWQMSLSSGRWRHPVLDDVLTGIRAHADASGLDVLLLTAMSSEISGEATHYGELCQAHGAEGIILVSFVPEEPELAVLAASDFPCVSIDTHLIGPRTSFISSDNVGGAVSAVRHLAVLGRTRIAYIGGWGHEPVSIDRRLGYESALDELGLERREEYVRTGGWLHDRARDEAFTLLGLAQPPDAIFCASDRTAVGVMLACEEAGLRVPEDVAVVGFDDEDFADLSSPSLTTVRQDRIGLGTASVEAILRMLDRPDAPPPAVVLPVELVIRESTGPERVSAARPKQAEVERGTPPEERLPVAEVFRQLRSAETAPNVEAAFGAEWHEHWRPEERRIIALASDTTPAQYTHAFFDEVFYGLRASAHEHSADLIILTHVWPDAGVFPPLLELCRRYEADGIVISALPPDNPEIVALTESDFPCVAFDVELLGKRSAFVSFDNVAAGIEVVRHLAESGRKRIAFIGGRGEERPSLDRQFGYKSELARQGLPYREEYVHAGHWLHNHAYEATQLMLGLPEPPDAIFCASDIMAIGAMAAIEDAGLRVPGDIAVAGIDDIEITRMLDPSLTSVRQNQTELVIALVDAMFDLLDHPDAPPKAVVLPIELIVRRSTTGVEALSAEGV